MVWASSSYGSYGRYAGAGASSGVQNVRTSVTDPIRVEWVATPTSGRLGLTIAPGKKGGSVHAYRWQRDLDMDLSRLAKTHHCDVLVSLMEDPELASLGIVGLVEKGKAHGVAVERFPIRDLGTPGLFATKALVNKITGWLAQGKNVVIHCRGGNGRMGTIAACTLAALGQSASQAIASVRSRRPKAVETSGQEQFVKTFAASL